MCCEGQSAGGVGGRPEAAAAGASVVYREVGGHRRHLPLHAQLQRSAADLRRVRQQLRLPPATHLGETLEAGTHRERNLKQVRTA